MVTIQTAAEILHTSVVTARKRLGVPDVVEHTKYNRPRFLYEPSRITAEADKAKSAEHAEKVECCRVCHGKFKHTAMVGGRCNMCRAKLCLMNFCCHNRVCHKGFDAELFRCIQEAVKTIQEGKENE